MYSPAAVGACTGILVAIKAASPNLTFILVIVPETKGASHLLLAASEVIEGFAVPELLSNASAFITEIAVVAGAKDIGA
ncbi:hypothetical protein FLTE109939_04860 [Flavobacterium terrigena]